MKIILILQDKEGKLSHHHPIDEKELAYIEKEMARLNKKIIYRLYIKTAFSIQRYDTGST